MSFSKRLIQATFSLASGSFEGGGNQAQISGRRVHCEIENAGGPQQSVMSMSVYGMDLTTMNQLSTIGKQYNQRSLNGIQVMAGSDVDGMALVFTGQIFNAFVDAQAQPTVALQVIASPGSFYATMPLVPVSIKGSADAAGIMSQLANQMGLNFENNGVNVKLSNPYYAGSPWRAAQAVAKHGDFSVVIENGILAIMPKGKARQGDVLLVSADDGSMMGYPAFVENNIIAKALYSPNARIGGPMQVQSSLEPANGQYMIRKINYTLESNVPNGSWEMDLEAVPLFT